jgi:hypothetical protein
MKTASVKSINLFTSVIQMSYDIVKANGGELKVNTLEGEGTEFIICLPII